MALHAFEKLPRHGKARRGADDRIDGAARTHCGLADSGFILVHPLVNRGGQERGEAMKAAAERAFLQLLPMAARELVSGDLVAHWSWIIGRHAFHAYRVSASAARGKGEIDSI